jgi:acyl-CoA thioesterase
VVSHLLARDAFSQWMGVSVQEADAGRSVLAMTVREDMVNGFGTLHGGVLFAFADSAFAFATNAGGLLSVAVDCSISYPVASRPGDRLRAVAIEQSTTNRLAFCEVTVTNQDDVAVGYFRGTVYRTTRPHVVGEHFG